MVSIIHQWRLALIASLALCALPAQAQETPATGNTPASAILATVPDSPSGLNGQLFYELLMAELSAVRGDFVNAAAFMLSAARETQDEQLFHRAAELTLYSRAGSRAIAVANEWQKLFPESRDANRFLLHVLLMLNQVSETQEPLAREMAWTTADAKPATYQGIIQLYEKVSNKVLAAAVVEQTLQADLQDPALAAAAWSTIGHMRLAANQKDLALQALKNAHAANSNDSATALLALALLQEGQAAAEPVVQAYMAHTPDPTIQLTYVRVLLEKKRIATAQQQLTPLLLASPEMAEAWLLQANIHALQRDWKQAMDATRRVENLALKRPLSETQRELLLRDAYLLSSRIALQQKDYEQTLAWLEKIPRSTDDLGIQSLKALALAKQGKLAQGRALIRAVPATGPEQVIRRRQAEVALLRESNAIQEAYLLQRAMHDQHPENPDIAYETATLAERAGKLDAMEKILQDLIRKHPENYQAFNMLGYHYADRNIRLPEAKNLIEQALQLAPEDPFVIDSLAWVEYRMGNHRKALELLEKAYAQRDDAEIAAHLTEVLWELGDQKRARLILRKALEADTNNSVLRTLSERLHIQP